MFETVKVAGMLAVAGGIAQAVVELAP